MKRTELKRTGGLKRGGPVNPKRKTPRRGRIVLDPAGRRELRLGVYDRAGHQCEAGVVDDCPGWLGVDEFEWHHRKLRSQQGGDTPTNSLCLCPGCHAWAHQHRADARARGLIVSSGHDPAMVAVHLADDRVVRLNRDLTYDLVFSSPETTTKHHEE